MKFFLCVMMMLWKNFGDYMVEFVGFDKCFILVFYWRFNYRVGVIKEWIWKDVGNLMIVCEVDEWFCGFNING